MSLTRSVFWLFVAEFLFYVSGYVVHFGAGRILGPEDYGRYGLVITATFLVANLIGNGIPIAMGKYLSEFRVSDPGRLQSVRRVGILLQTIVMGGVSLLFFLAVPGIATLLGDSSLAPLFQISAFIIPCFAADAYYFYFYSGIQKFGVQSALKIIRSLLRMTVILALAYFFSVKGIVVGYILVPLTVFLVAWGIDVFSSIGAMPPASGKRFPMKNLAQLAIPVTSFLVLFEILMSFDLYFIKYVFGDDALAGQWNAALTIARIPTFLFYALTIVLLPTIAESFSKEDDGRMREIVSGALRFMLLLSFPFVVLAIVFAKPAVTLLFGTNFLFAAAFLPPLVSGTAILAIFYVLSFAYKGRGNVRFPIAVMTAGIVINLVLDFILLPSFGVIAIAYGKLFAALALIPFFLRSLSRTFDVRIDWRSLGTMAFAAALIFALASFSSVSVGAMLLFSPVLFVVYFLILFFLGTITTDDLALLKVKK